MHRRLAILAGLAVVVLGVVVAARLSTPAGSGTTTGPVPSDGGRVNHPPAQAPPVPPREPWASVNWTRLDEPLFDVPEVSSPGVATDGSRVVVWDQKADKDGVGPEGRRSISIVWTSNDGVTWDRHEAKLPTGDPFQLVSVTVSPSGYVAVGSRGGPFEFATSIDGEAWTVLGPWPGLAGGVRVFGMANGFVTAGLLAGRPVVLVSPDGVDWRPIHGPGQPGQYRISDVVRAADGLLIAGAVGAVGNWDGLLWRWTVDGGLVDVLGRQKAFVGPDRSVSIYEAVLHANGVYLLGATEEPAPAQCGLREGQLAAVGPPVADVCGRTELAWASSDLVRWQEIEGPPSHAGPDTLAAGIDGVVSIVEEGPAGQAPGDNEGLWTSPDGIEWRRLGDGISLPTGLVVLPGRLVAFNQGQLHMGIGVWIGTPGG